MPYLQILLGKDPQSAEARSKAIQALSDMRGGNADNGKLVFRRNCTACHKVCNEGADYGPQMDGKEPVGKRLTKYKIVESIIDPNAEVDKKYLSTAHVDDGRQNRHGVARRRDSGTRGDLRRQESEKTVPV